MAQRLIAFGVLVLITASITSAQSPPSPAAPQCPGLDSYGSDPSKGAFARVNGVATYYEIHGSGSAATPVLLIHGNGGSIVSRRCQLHHFAATRRVIAVDSRGRGKSEVGSERLTYELLADDVAALLDHLKIDSTDVLGHSDGGIIGLALAMRHPTKVRRLVSSSPNLRVDPAALVPFFSDRVRRDSEEAAAKIKAKDSSRDWAVRKRTLDLMLEEPNIPSSSLKRITAPTLIVGGDDDIMPLEHLVEIYKNIPQAQLFIIPGGTHRVDLQYELFNAISSRFLDQPFVRLRSRDPRPQAP